MAKRRRGQSPAPGRAVGRARTSETRPTRRRISSDRRPDRPDRPTLLVGAIAVAVVIAVGLLGLALVSGVGRPNYACAQLLQPDPGASVENPIVTPSYGGDHLAVGSRLEYASCPPASGPHYSQAGLAPARPGFYDPDDVIGPGSWVHNLEHGFVVALYRCVDGTCPSEEDLSDLRQFVLQGPSTPSAVACNYQSKVLAARFDDMATPFALLAWQRVLLLDSFDTAVALDFARRSIDVTGPEANC